MPAAYWLDLRGYDPAAIARELPLPILLLQGGRDYQVEPSELRSWRRAVPQAQVRFYPSLNHLFMAGSGPRDPAEYAVPGHVAERPIEDLAAWIRALPPLR